MSTKILGMVKKNAQFNTARVNQQSTGRAKQRSGSIHVISAEKAF